MAFVSSATDAGTPKKCFLNGELKNKLSCCINTVNGRLLTPVVTMKIDLDIDCQQNGSSINVTYKLVKNGEMLVVYPNYTDDNIDIELASSATADTKPDIEYTFFTYYKKSLSKRSNKTFKIPVNEFYFTNPSLDFAIITHHSVFKSESCCFSLCVFDKTVHRKTTKGKLMKNIYEINYENKILFHPHCDFSMDGDTFCFVSNGMNRATIIGQRAEFCYIDIFSCLKGENQPVVLKHCLGFDLSTEVISCHEVLDCLLNVSADKVMIIFLHHYIIFSISRKCVIAKGFKNMTDNIRWVCDYAHGELLVNVNTISSVIAVYKIDFQQNCLAKYRSFSFSDYLTIPRSLFSKQVFNISNGIVRVFISDVGKICVFDPFSLKCLCMLSLPYRENYITKEILFNWPGNEILVIEDDKFVTAENPPPPVLSVFNLGWRNDVSLKFIAAVTVMRKYSKLELQKMNLPKHLMYYLNLK